jgi:hypothetical protein
MVMRSGCMIFLASAILGMLGFKSLVPSVWAQTAATTSPPTSSHNWLLVLLLGTAVTGLLIVMAKAIDVKRQRDEEGVQLQAQISDALLRDQTLVSLPVTATVYIPLWRRSPATVEVHGEVPSADLRQAALRVAAQEAARTLATYYIQDRIMVVPSMRVRAA